MEGYRPPRGGSQRAARARLGRAGGAARARGRDPARRAARGSAAIPVAVRMKAQGPPHRVERRRFSESKKPRRGGLPQAAKK